MPYDSVTRIVTNKNSNAKADSINNYTIDTSAIIKSVHYNTNEDDTGDNSATYTSNIMIKSTQGIFGIPYQFRPIDDRRLTGTEIGAKYGEKIVSKMPLLFMVPCRQKFMDGYNKTQKSTVMEEFLKGDVDDKLLQSVITDSGKYYRSVWDWPTYYKYVNSLCYQMAIYMGIANVKIPTTKLGSKKLSAINWSVDMNNEAFNRYFNAQNSVVFYVDGSSVNTMSESFSNSTTESSLASQLNGYSDTVNEIKFLLGENNGVMQMAQEAATELSNGIIGNLGEAFSSLTGGMLADLASKGSSSLVSGGKLVFPKLWQDSSFSRSYSFDIKLRSPDHDPLSIYLNIMVPYLHLLALVLPVSHEDNPNAYNAPFLVKAYCKGLFNIDMGMITDMSVTRGAECQWTDDGLPTQMDISITIEDLYSSLYMSALNSTSFPLLINQLKNELSLVRNTSMMDYLANLAGMNLADEQIGRSARMLVQLAAGTTAPSIVNDVYNKFDLGIANLIKILYQ